MNNEQIVHKSWWNRNWKWVVSICAIILVVITVFFSSGLGRITTDIAQAYTDTGLYENALAKINADPKVNELLGEVQPLGKITILEGETKYSNNYQTVNSTVRIVGTKGKAKMDISADRITDQWVYSKINIRIKNLSNKKQTVQINVVE